MHPKRVKITYSLEFDEILGEVARLLAGKGRPHLKQADRSLDLASTVLSKGSVLESVEHIKSARDALATVDYLLADSMGILLGYANTKTSANEEELRGPPTVEDPPMEQEL